MKTKGEELINSNSALSVTLNLCISVSVYHEDDFVNEKICQIKGERTISLPREGEWNGGWSILWGILRKKELPG